MSLSTRFETVYMRLHQSLYVRSDGRVGHGLLVVVPSLLLRTTGRRTGTQRTSALAYARDGDSYVLVASNGAKEQSPAWYFNLCANPKVELQVGRARLPGIAQAVHKGEPDQERRPRASARECAREGVGFVELLDPAYERDLSRRQLIAAPSHRPTPASDRGLGRPSAHRQVDHPAQDGVLVTRRDGRWRSWRSWRSSMPFVRRQRIEPRLSDL